jgi:hypothetical protein
MKLKDLKLGATGRYPFGHSRPDDEGELRAALAVDRAQGVIRIEFGKPVAWLALPSGYARELARLLVEKADELDKGKA